MPEIRNPNLQTQGPGGGNSGGGGGDLRSTMGFGLLLVVVLFGYQYFFKAKTEPPAPQNQAQVAQNAAPAPGQAAGDSSNSGSPQAAAPVSAGTATVTATMETETTVENEQYRIVLTNRGAQVKHWILKKYLDTAGKPLDMVQQQASAKFGLPLSFFTYEPALTQQLNGALYQVTVEGAQPSATGLVLAPTTISFHYQASGLDVVKTLHFDTSYVIGIDAAVKRNGSPVRALVQWPSGLGDMEEFLPRAPRAAPFLRRPTLHGY